MTVIVTLLELALLPSTPVVAPVVRVVRADQLEAGYVVRSNLVVGARRAN